MCTGCSLRSCFLYKLNKFVRFFFLKKICHAHFYVHKPPTNLKKIVNMNVDVSETVKDRELGPQI